MMTRKTFISLIAATIAATSLGAFGLGSPTQTQNHPDCPGRIVCPITGDLVCRDRCPLGKQAADRLDCPGRIDCPITGDLVCRDRCPLGDQDAAEKTTATALPSCCQNRN